MRKAMVVAACVAGACVSMTSAASASPASANPGQVQACAYFANKPYVNGGELVGSGGRTGCGTGKSTSKLSSTRTCPARTRKLENAPATASSPTP